MYTKQAILLVVAAILAIASATSAQEQDKRYLRLGDSPAISLPSNIKAYKRDEASEMASKRLYRPEGSPPFIHVPPHTEAVRRADEADVKLKSRPLDLRIAAGSSHPKERSMPLELDPSTYDSLPKYEQEEYSKRYVLEGPDGHMYFPKPVGSSHVTPM